MEAGKDLRKEAFPKIITTQRRVLFFSTVHQVPPRAQWPKLSVRVQASAMTGVHVTTMNSKRNIKWFSTPSSEWKDYGRYSSLHKIKSEKLKLIFRSEVVTKTRHYLYRQNPILTIPSAMMMIVYFCWRIQFMLDSELDSFGNTILWLCKQRRKGHFCDDLWSGHTLEKVEIMATTIRAVRFADWGWRVWR